MLIKWCLKKEKKTQMMSLVFSGIPAGPAGDNGEPGDDPAGKDAGDGEDTTRQDCHLRGVCSTLFSRK